MNVLFYNWVQYDDSARRGGGVTAYLRNLIERMAEDPQVQCVFLSSGLEYTFDGRLQIVETKNIFSDRIKSYQIINSPVHAPACVQFHDLHTYLNDTTLLEAIAEFIQGQGGFDIIHFHSLEGLSLPVLRLKDYFPDLRMYYSLHNYFLFCPQVNLWTNREENCFVNPQFPRCCQCVQTADGKAEGFISSVRNGLSKYGLARDTALFQCLKAVAGRIRKFSVKQQSSVGNSLFPSTDSSREIFRLYRKKNIVYANQYFDGVLAVSRKVAEIAASYGIDRGKLIVDYIGTAVASSQQPPKHSAEYPLHIGYFGYARADKGFDFLLTALESLPDPIASKLIVILAAKCDTPAEYVKYQAKIESIAPRYFELQFQDGYSKQQQEELLATLDLGIVPVLWEDNLPQVAIEYIAAGVPILASDRGGAQELCTDANFVFQGGNVEDFLAKLSSIAVDPGKLTAFWRIPPQLTTMEDHWRRLKKQYTQKEC